MGKHSVIEMIEYVRDKLGENEGFNRMEIDKTTYYNYKKGGNPNKKKLAKITAVFNQLSTEVPHGTLREDEHPYKTKNPSSEPGLVQMLLSQIRDKDKIIEMLEQRISQLQDSIGLAETLKIVSGQLDHFLNPPQKTAEPVAAAGEVEPTVARVSSRKVADKSGSSDRKASHK